jgi:serine phosphatase RsbU (regulator of sigma subunit)
MSVVDVHRRLRAARIALGTRQHELDREREVASGLRRAARPVPAGPAEIDGVRLVARHRPADAHAQVGGDWCDWRPLPDRRLLLAVGDAVGHGLPAAGTMLRVRHSVAALAASGLPPQRVLATANSLLCSGERTDGTGEMATALVAIYDSGTHVLCWASAGHPPIVFADAMGTAWTGANPPGPMLGAYPDARYEGAVARLYPGGTVLLYTDGYVETRRTRIDDGINALVATVGDAAGGPYRRLNDALTQLAPRNPQDDACLLAAHVMR